MADALHDDEAKHRHDRLARTLRTRAGTEKRTRLHARQTISTDKAL